MNNNIFYGMYGYEVEGQLDKGTENTANFTPLSKQCELEYVTEAKADVTLKDAESFASQEMGNPQLDLDVPKCLCARQ